MLASRPLGHALAAAECQVRVFGQVHQVRHGALQPAVPVRQLLGASLHPARRAGGGGRTRGEGVGGRGHYRPRLAQLRTALPCRALPPPSRRVCRWPSPASDAPKSAWTPPCATPPPSMQCPHSATARSGRARSSGLRSPQRTSPAPEHPAVPSCPARATPVSGHSGCKHGAGEACCEPAASELPPLPPGAGS